MARFIELNRPFVHEHNYSHPRGGEATKHRGARIHHYPYFFMHLPRILVDTLNLQNFYLNRNFE